MPLLDDVSPNKFDEMAIQAGNCNNNVAAVGISVKAAAQGGSGSSHGAQAAVFLRSFLVSMILQAQVERDRHGLAYEGSGRTSNGKDRFRWLVGSLSPIVLLK